MRRNYLRNRDWSDPKWQEHMKEYQDRRQRGRAFFGIAVAVVGILWICSIIFHYDFDLELHWPFILIGVGVLVGLRSKFSNPGWWILILIGTVNIVQLHFAELRPFVWPGAMILAGLAIAFRPRGTSRGMKKCVPDYKVSKSITEESNLNIDVTFGGRKEVVTSRDFKGGNISVTFGGCELNFMQADFQDTAILDVRVSFGGIEIIVPSHWQVQNEISPSFGNIEDERNIQTSVSNEQKKLLIIRGTCSFGNVEIKGY
ncbi:MAG: hypothetical protein H7257_15180 [Taibaiella sp.]|nr:hypothetical protein [Taibaiella sp.]